jgi:hypothetical protein
MYAHITRILINFFIAIHLIEILTVQLSGSMDCIAPSVKACKAFKHCAITDACFATLELIQVELEKVKFFAKPKLGLGCVGGASDLRLSDALAQVS